MGSDGPERLLIALDVDGTVLHEDGYLSPAVQRAVADAVARGHEVMLATGRSAAATIPVAVQLGIEPDYLVSSNGAVILRRDPGAPDGYRRDVVETFDPAPVLTTISGALTDARYAVEDADGFFRFTARFPEAAVGLGSQEVAFEDLLAVEATRVVVISPNHAMEEFLGVVERMGLHRVSYAVGWTAWLDIAPDGVNKATAMERVRERLGVPIDRTVSVGDGRNDIEMLEWAGRGVAMGQAPEEVRAAADEITAAVHADGLARLLARLPDRAAADRFAPHAWRYGGDAMTTDAGAPTSHAGDVTATARDRLLAKVADFVLANGVSDLSLSELARRVGSNNRMLLYYFGSKEQLLGEACVLAITRFPSVDTVMTRFRGDRGPLRDRLLEVWNRIADPDNLPYLALFFQAFAVALYDPGRSARVAELMGGTWTPHVVAAMEESGFSPDAAEAIATEILAELRGLQFALLAGTDRAVLDRAWERYVDGLPSA